MEQFHENGYFADPQTINELAQYWEDQKNIDSLLGDARDDDADKTGTPQETHTALQDETAVSSRSQPQQELQPTELLQDAGVQDAGEHTADNALSSLVNYSSSDEES